MVSRGVAGGTGAVPDKVPPFRGVSGFTNSYITSGQTDPPTIPVHDSSQLVAVNAC